MMSVSVWEQRNYGDNVGESFSVSLVVGDFHSDFLIRLDGPSHLCDGLGAF